MDLVPGVTPKKFQNQKRSTLKIACQSEIKGTLFLKASCDLIFYLQKKSDFLFQNKKIFCLIWKSLLINQNNVQNKFENSLILVKMFL